uniref:Uncharacterized protein n=1 Tax=Micrurus spixii TaxID=129469 RepID=A0A2D4LL00_9SAUR
MWLAPLLISHLSAFQGTSIPVSNSKTSIISKYFYQNSTWHICGILKLKVSWLPHNVPFYKPSPFCSSSHHLNQSQVSSNSFCATLYELELSKNYILSTKSYSINITTSHFLQLGGSNES